MKVRLLSLSLLVALVSAFVLVPAGSVAAKNDKKANPFKGVKAQARIGDATVNVTEFAVNAAGKLVASGTVTSDTRGTLGTFSDAPVTVQQVPDGDECEILTLRLDPIRLNLLGLVVETSHITLVITADPDGGLLGALLCAVANLLNDESALAQLLNRILALLGGTLSGGSVLTGAMPITVSSFANKNGQLVANFFVNLADGTRVGPFVTPAQVIEPPEGSCEILTLTLGPIDIELLGLRIQLYGDEPEDPITILIYAVPGEGNLLGNLLCAITRLLDGPPTPSFLDQLVRFLNRLLGLFG